MSGPQVVVEVALNGKAIDLYSPYFEGVSDLCKMVPGHRPVFDKSTGRFSHWRYPLDMQTCRLLRKAFTDLLVIGPELTTWARKAKRVESKMRRITKKTDADLVRVPQVLPRIDAAMASRTYQRVGAAFMAASPTGAILLGDQPGLGKTIQTLAGIAERGVERGMHLVACPATAVDIVWSKEVQKWTDWPVWAATGGAAKRHKTIAAFFDAPAETKFLIINPEMLATKIGRWCAKCKRFEEAFDNPAALKMHLEEKHNTVPRVFQQKYEELFVPEWSSVTIDESHRFLVGIRGSTYNKKTMTGEGACRIRVKDGGLKIALSGTPIKGKAINFWGTLHWGNPSVYRSKWQWAEQYLEVSSNGFGQKIGGLRPEREQELYRSLDTVLLRRTKAEVAKDLPPKEYHEHWVDPGAKQTKQYRDILAEGETMFGDKRIAVIGFLAELLRLKQIATAFQGTDGPILSESCKFQFLLEMLQDRGVVGPKDERFGDSKFVIASQFTQVINAMEAEFKKMDVDVLKITGEVTTKKRREAQNAFQAEGGVRIILINTMAGGVAIDLDQQCDELFFMDETFVPDDQEQVEDRIHRVSRIHQVTIHYIYARGSIDEAIALSNVSKDEIQKQILDGRRGVEFVLRLLKEMQK